jgi:hypothetical protein
MRGRCLLVLLVTTHRVAQPVAGWLGVIAGWWGVEPTVGRLPLAPIDQRLHQPKPMHGITWLLFFPALRVATHGMALPVAGSLGVTAGGGVVGVTVGGWLVEPTVGRLPSAPIDQRLHQPMHGLAWLLFFPALRVATHGVALPVAGSLGVTGGCGVLGRDRRWRGGLM